jgi:hypothetical protein
LELITQISTAPLWVIVGALLFYLTRQIFEGRLKSEFTRMEKLVDSSLGVKTGLRDEEQKALADFQVAISDWEHQLNFGIGELLTKPGFDLFDPAGFYEKDRSIYESVRRSAARASVYLRSEALYAEIQLAILTIWNNYYPLITTALEACIEPQAPVRLILIRTQKFEASGGLDMQYAPNEADRAALNDANVRTTAILAEFCKAVTDQYPQIGERLVDLRNSINSHIYRPLDTYRIDEPAKGLGNNRQGKSS